MFDLMEGRYQVMVTDQKLKSENVWRLYNRGVVVEQVIEELKNDLAATSMHHKSFWASEALFLSGAIACNLPNCMRRLALPAGGNPVRAFCEGSKPRRIYQQHRDLGAARHLVGHATEEGVVQALAGVGGHDDKVGSLIPGASQYLLRRPPL